MIYRLAQAVSSAAALTTSEKGELSLSTTLTGMAIVFGVLVLLTFLITLFGWAFRGTGAGASDKTPKTVPPPKQEKPAPKAPVQPIVKTDKGEDGDELAAVIAAAVWAYGQQNGKQLAVRSVRRARTGRSAWANAGIADVTASF